MHTYTHVHLCVYARAFTHFCAFTSPFPQLHHHNMTPYLFSVRHPVSVSVGSSAPSALGMTSSFHPTKSSPASNDWCHLKSKKKQQTEEKKRNVNYKLKQSSIPLSTLPLRVNTRHHAHMDRPLSSKINFELQRRKEEFRKKDSDFLYIVFVSLFGQWNPLKLQNASQEL